eukprot:1161890-Pelagomonas_calceolata.AAC.3
MIRGAQGLSSTVQKAWFSLARAAAQHPTQSVQPLWNRASNPVDGAESTSSHRNDTGAVGGFTPLPQVRCHSTSSSQVRPASPEDDASAQAHALAGMSVLSDALDSDHTVQHSCKR